MASEGRWAVLRRPSVLGPSLSDEERADQLARILLARYGVVTRECLEHEMSADWALLYPVLQRMELRAEVRRGLFVSGLSGVQFALPEAVERLRATMASAEQALVVLNACDPANLFGGDLPEVAGRFARLPSNWCVLARGKPILIAEENGERIRTDLPMDSESVRQALQALLARPHAPRHITVTQWNGEAILGTRAETLLGSLGFQRVPKGMEL